MSRIALISDIHANLPALEAVMKDIEQLQCNAVYCLGDVVGYNANPSECLEFIRSRQIPTVRGNHDEEAIGEDNPAGMNPVAYNADVDAAATFRRTEKVASPRSFPAHSPQ